MARKRQRSASPPASTSPSSPLPRTRLQNRVRRMRQAHQDERQVPRAQSIFSQGTELSDETQATNLTTAYDRISKYNPRNREYDHLVKRSLEAFLEYLPVEGRDEVVKDILKTEDDDDIYKVFSNYYTGLRTRMRSRSRPPSITSSPNPKRALHAEAISTMDAKPAAREKKFREDLLKRDNYCCVATGDMDKMHWEQLGCPPHVETWAPTEEAHIIPFSYASWDLNQSDPPPQFYTAWEVLWRCFPGVRAMNFDWDHINDLLNGITLTDWMHKRFGAFQLAFKATNIENLYEIKTFSIPEKHKKLIAATVEFKNYDKDNDRALPSAILLDCHFRLAEILNASGMAEAFDLDYRRWEDLKGSTCGQLRTDGGTDVGEILWAILDGWGYAVG